MSAECGGWAPIMGSREPARACDRAQPNRDRDRDLTVTVTVTVKAARSGQGQGGTKRVSKTVPRRCQGGPTAVPGRSRGGPGAVPGRSQGGPRSE